MHRGADILFACHVLSCFDCPPIPLSRLIPYARVRRLRDDVSGLKAAFDEIINKWDAIWKDINDEFKQELSKSVQLKNMSNYTFYVWEGNHRIVAWIDAIQERIDLYNNWLSHDVDSMNTHSLVATHIHDKIINTTHICAADRKEKVKKAVSKEEEDTILCDIVLNPSLGTDWLAKVLGLKWGADSWATLEKINMIAAHDAHVQNGFIQRGFFARIYDRANHMVTDFLDVLGGVDLSHDCTLGFYFDEIKHEAQPYLYPKEVELEGRSKEGNKHTLKKVDVLRMAAQRLAYRFLSFLVSKIVLSALPFLARQWTPMSTLDSCMYSTELHDLTSWEIEHCPWWIDMRKGQLLIRERELKQAMIRDDTSSGSIRPRGCGGQWSTDTGDRARG
ncbi:hypothetical protein L7F22_059350 [Adiantum nelumboides]|nr:hypothetical protein [Adiantum nelumboides]